ncbi:hypothetical protein BH11BAC6_BH11BAC6_16010 [soil metagenome]
MKKLFALLALMNAFHALAQIKPADAATLGSMQDSLKIYSTQMIRATEASARFYADSVFIKKFVQALKITNSFYYPFDSVKTISKLYAPDSSFRIYTWQLEKDESYFRQYGAIQMRTSDGSLNLFPLFDQSDYASVPTDSVRSNRNWIGAIYYQVVLKEFNGRKYYTLIGLDDNDFSSTRKWIEVLQFDNAGQPVFGGNFFTYKSEANKPDPPVARFCLEFKKDANAKLNYDQQLDLIIFDHLVSETADENNKYNLIPNGDYEGFKWSNGKWVHMPNVFPEQQSNQVPVPRPLKDDDGNPPH